MKLSSELKLESRCKMFGPLVGVVTLMLRNLRCTGSTHGTDVGSGCAGAGV